MAYPYGGILFYHKKEWSADTCYNTNTSRKYHAKQKKLFTKTTYFIIPFLWMFRIDKCIKTESRLVVEGVRHQFEGEGKREWVEC